MNKNKLGFLLSLILLISSCMSAPKTKPDFEDYVPAAFWGLTPPAYPVNTAKVCPNQQMPVEVRKGKSAEDWVLAFFSLGIYWPHTVQVWCPAIAKPAKGTRYRYPVAITFSEYNVAQAK